MHNTKNHEALMEEFVNYNVGEPWKYQFARILDPPLAAT
jgi:hypothetical protein